MGSRHEERGSRADRERRGHGDRSASRAKEGHRSRPPAERPRDGRRDDSRARERLRSPRRDLLAGYNRSRSQGREREPEGRPPSRSALEGRSRLQESRGRDSPRGSPRAEHRRSPGRRTVSPLTERNHRSRREEQRLPEKVARKQPPPARERGAAEPAPVRRLRSDATDSARDQSHRDSRLVTLRSERRRSPSRRTDSPLARRSRRGHEERRPAETAREQPRRGDKRPAEPARAHRRRSDTPGRARHQSHRDSPGGPPARLPPLPSLPPPPPPQQQPAADAAALDFFSAQFDAALALRTPGLQPPNPAVVPLQMLQQCRFILPAELPESLAGAQFQPKPEEEQAEARARSGPAARRRQAAELKHSVVDRIAAAVTRGPLLLLRRCFEAGARVRVVTRHARGVRGWAEGALMAFDKHMNLVLADVEEAYTVRLRIERTKQQLRLRPPAAEQPEQPEQLGASEAGQQAEQEAGPDSGAAPAELSDTAGGSPVVAAADDAAGGSPTAADDPAGGSPMAADDSAGGSPPPEAREGGYELVERTRTAFKQEHRRRRLKQIFVRGSNVVLVCAVPPAAQPVAQPG